jgi:vacuolar protein sorting-associated protein 13A/C
VHQVSNPLNGFTLGIGSRAPFHFTKNIKEKHVYIQVQNPLNPTEMWAYSGYIDLTTQGDNTFYCSRIDQFELKYFKISTVQDDAILYLTITEEPSYQTSMQILNNLDSIDILANQVGFPKQTFSIPCGKKCPIAWSDPSFNNTMIVSLVHTGEDEVYSEELEFKFDRVNEKITDMVQFKNGKQLLLTYVVKLIGHSRILKFSMKNENIVKLDQPQTELTANFKGIGLSLIAKIHKKRKELIYLLMSQMNVGYFDSKYSTVMQFRVKALTIDNMVTPDVQYPVMLYPDYLVKSSEKDKEIKQHINVIYKTKKLKHSTDTTYIYALTVYLAETSFNLDGKSLNAFVALGKKLTKISSQSTILQNNLNLDQFIFLNKQKRQDFIEERAGQQLTTWKNFDTMKSINAPYLFIQNLTIHPIYIHFTFKSLAVMKKGSFMVRFANNVLGRTLANFDRAPITLKGVHMDSFYGTQTDLMKSLLKRYISSIIETLMGVVLSINIFGAPIKFFERITSGVTDLVDQPRLGLNEGTIECGQGLVSGTRSLASKTVGATFDSLHDMTDAVASGISGWAGDPEYTKKRDLQNCAPTPNVLKGSQQAGKCIGRGVKSGVSGVVTRPTEGAKEEGVKGLVKGLYRGARGLVMKPAAGIFDGVSKMSEGIANNLLDPRVPVPRTRLPRVFYGLERNYKDYSADDAKLLSFLSTIKKKYASLAFVEALYLLNQHSEGLEDYDGDLCVAITMERVFLINLKNKGAVLWNIKSKDIDTVSANSFAVNIEISKKTKKGIEEGGVAMIPCLDENARTFILDIFQEFKALIQ